MPLLNRKDTKTFNDYMLKLNVLADCDRLDKTKYVTIDVLEILNFINGKIKAINSIPVDISEVTSALNKYEDLRTAGKEIVLTLTSELNKDEPNDMVISDIMLQLKDNFNID